MSARLQLERYLDALRRRLATHIYVRAAAVVAVAALLLSVIAVWLLRRDGFDVVTLAASRIVLALSIGGLAVLLLWGPLRRLRFRHGAHEFERRLPIQNGRIQTFMDAQRSADEGTRSPLTDLLASDALALTADTPVEKVVSPLQLLTAAAVTSAALAALAFMLIAGPDYWGYGSRHLLLGMQLPSSAVPVRLITVKPGNITVRRNSDLTLQADVSGFTPDRVQVYVRFDDQQEWERAPMQMIDSGTTQQWRFKLYALRGSLRYYVAAEEGRKTDRSAEHNVAIVDLPHIDRVRLTYDYPEWTGLEAQTEETVRDIRAVEGTRVKVEVFANAALDAPVIVVDGDAAAMKAAGTSGSGDITVKQAGSYHIAARVADELVALTDDYPIEIVPDEKPSIEIRKPGRDAQATSIEEVPVAVSARDDFRLQQVALRYSVNGGEWQTMPLGNASGTRATDAHSLLRMEELGAKQGKGKQPVALQPGDLVTYYAVARDRRETVQTDLFMVQVQPFERRFSEGQAGGNGQGMGDDQGAISERQREILLATWNLQRSEGRATRSRAQLEENARMLSDLQKKLSAQALTLAQRMRARASVEDDARVKQFVESLEQAAAAMDPAAKHLHDFELEAAVPVEQQALQQLLRAEAAFRDVQIAMQRESAQGGQQSARNFTEMFELEMDVDKNHYETQSPLSQRNERDELDEAIRKLKELAERQERLAQQMNRNQAQREQRWQQEQLRREAEDLQRRLAELSRSQSQASPADPNGSQSGQPSSQSSSRPGQRQDEQSERERTERTGESQQRNASAQAMESMRQALENMRSANESSAQSDDSRQAARDASRNLRQALDKMNQPQGGGMAQALDEMAERAGKLSDQQNRVEGELYSALSDAMNSARERGQLAPSKAQKLIETKQRMAEEVGEIQRDMRAALNDHRGRSPQATERLTQTLHELEDANLTQRLNRSAAEIRYGRARDAAPREGLIADALSALESDLRDAARLAAGESERGKDNPTPERLLAELGDLRRMVQQQQSAAAREQSQRSQANRADQQKQQSQQTDGAARGQGGGQPSGGNARANSMDPGSVTDLNGAAFEDELASSRREELARSAQRLEAMTNRGTGIQLSAAEIDALRRLTREARRLAGDPVSARLQEVAQLVDRLELATLAAIEKGRNASSAHTPVATPDSPEYEDAVAEYYRRLGGSCGSEEGGRAC